MSKNKSPKMAFTRKPCVIATGIAISLMAAQALAQTPAPEPQKIDKIEITGSSIKRVDAESALPVTVVTRADIEKSGVQSTEDLLAQITSVSSAGGTNNASQSGLSTYGQSSVSLRGIGSDKTLVLVNGRRLALFAGGGASVNINAIPLGAIERVEVLQDGASGVYGSDAIAGVVNFILRKDFKGVELSASYGEPTRGGGAKLEKYGIVAGFGDYDKNRFAVTVSGAFEKEGNLLGAEREYAKTDTKLPFFAGGATETGRIEGVWQFPGGATLLGAGTNGRSATNPFGVSGTGYGNPSAAKDDCASIGMVPRAGRGFIAGSGLAPVIPDAVAKNCTFDTGRFVSLVPKREFQGLTANVRFKLSDTTELYGEGIYSRNEFTNPIQPAPLRQAFYAGNPRFAGSGVDPILLIYPSNPNYAFAANYLNSVGLGAMVGKPLAVSQRTFLLGPRTTNDIATQDRFIVGAKGTLANLDYDVAYAVNTSETKGNVIDGFASIFELSKVLNNPTTLWNPWAPGGVQSPEVAKLIEGTKYKGPTISSKSKNDGFDGKISGSAMQLGGGSLEIAGGVQARNEEYVLTPSAATLSGDVIGLGGAITPVNAKRTVWALFMEANLPITKQFEGTVAVRQDSYNDFGKTINSKVSGRYQPSSYFLVRGSVGTGFKAPSLPALYTPQQINTSEQFTDPKFPGNGQIQVTSIAGGNPNLKPEKSDQYGMGIVLSPFKSFTASFDYFNIKIDGLIVAPSAQEIASGFRRGAPGYSALVEVNGADEITLIRQLSANISTLKTQGLDIDLRFRENFGGGRLDVGLQGTYTDKYDLVNASGELERSVGTTVRPDGAPLVSSATGVILKWKHNLNVGYTYGPVSATLTQRYYKGYEGGNDLDGNRQFVPSQATYDLVASFTGIKNLRLSVGARNLFDKDPPLFINNGSQFQAGYDIYQYDPRGRFVYVTAAYKFF
jgi:iron complex outermembrane recepter protein